MRRGPSRARLPRTARLGAAAAVLVALATVPLWGSAYIWSFSSMILMWVGLTLSWNIISGYTGYVSLGHTAFFGMGAYVGSLLLMELHMQWGLAALVAGLVTALVAAPIGYILLRLKGPFFAVGMLGLSEVFRIASLLLSDWTGGGAGLYLDATDDIWMIYAGFLVAAAAAFATTWVIHSLPYGRGLLAIRDDEEAAEVLGVRTTRSKVTAFIISAFFPGVIGTCYAVFLSYMDPATAFPVEFNLIFVLMGALGGAGTVVGPVIGAVLVGGLRESLWISFPRLNLILFGVGMVLTVLLLPNGIVNSLRRVVPRLLRRSDPEAGVGHVSAGRELDLSKLELTGVERRRRQDQPLLRVESVARSFSKRMVIEDCSFTVPSGSITGLIGPNGSGKTTTLNLVNGILALNGGRVWFDGRRIDRMKPHRIADAGVGRTFQLPRLFDRLSVLDNMLVGGHAGLRPDVVRQKAGTMLEVVGLQGLEQRPASKLSYGQRKLLEIARVLMVEPRLILMDEPMAGVNPVLREKIAELITELRSRGITFLVIGHEMTEMMTLCDRIVVMDQGSVMRIGSPAEIQADQQVFEAYFGSRSEFIPQGGTA